MHTRVVDSERLLMGICNDEEYLHQPTSKTSVIWVAVGHVGESYSSRLTSNDRNWLHLYSFHGQEWLYNLMSHPYSPERGPPQNGRLGYTAGRSL
jgi:hypothetical protein